MSDVFFFCHSLGNSGHFRVERCGSLFAMYRVSGNQGPTPRAHQEFLVGLWWQRPKSSSPPPRLGAGQDENINEVARQSAQSDCIYYLLW